MAQVSRTFLSILADRNNAVVSMVSIRCLISNSSSLFPSLCRLIQVHQRQLVLPSSLCSSYFSSLSRSKYLFIFLFSIIFTLLSIGREKIPLIANTFFFVINHFWPFGRDNSFTFQKRIIYISFSRTDSVCFCFLLFVFFFFAFFFSYTF